MLNKLKIYLTNIIAITLTYLFTLTPVNALENGTISLPVEGNQGTRITLTETNNSNTQSITIDDSNKGEFNLSYIEPGTYSYTITTSDKSDKPIKVDVYVVNSNTDNSLKPIVIAEASDGKKLDKISFYKSKHPIKQNNINNAPTASNENQTQIYLSMFTVLCGFVIILFDWSKRKESTDE